MHEFQLPDMTCGHCAGMVGQTLHLADPDCRIQVDLPARKVTVHSDEDREVLADALTDAGYPPA
jgi:copper chaperone